MCKVVSASLLRVPSIRTEMIYTHCDHLSYVSVNYKANNHLQKEIDIYDDVALADSDDISHNDTLTP